VTWTSDKSQNASNQAGAMPLVRKDHTLLYPTAPAVLSSFSPFLPPFTKKPKEKTSVLKIEI
jgi:hypothetical protein